MEISQYKKFKLTGYVLMTITLMFTISVVMNNHELNNAIKLQEFKLQQCKTEASKLNKSKFTIKNIKQTCFMIINGYNA